MIATLASALLILVASLVIGRAILLALGHPHPTWLAPAIGFATLVIAAPLLVRLPGRATTAALILLASLIAAAIITARQAGLERWRSPARLSHRRERPDTGSTSHETTSEEEAQNDVATSGDPGERPASGASSGGAPGERPAAGSQGADANPGERAERGSPRSRTVGSEVAGDPRFDRATGPAADHPAPGRATTNAWIALAAVAIVLAASLLPFAFNERFGVLGQGIYTNDHAAQLYWADWLKTGFGPEPEAVQFGYPVGPQSVAAVVAEATGANLVDAFNGLLIAIPALTALAALALLAGLPPGRRVAAASLAALPYLGAAFLAQSAFKETAMALLVLAFAIVLREYRLVPVRATLVALVLLAAGAVFTYSVAGLSWFAAALGIWLALELAAGRRPLAIGRLRGALDRHRLLVAAGALVIAVGAIVAAGPAIAFVERIADVFFSAGRLSSPVFPGEALGVWPSGDYRLVRGDVTGAIPAAAIGLVALAIGTWALVRRGEVALLATLGAAIAVYLGARVLAEIHVQAKALAVMAPLVMLVSLRAVLAPAGPREPRKLAGGRIAFGLLFALAAALSTSIALRAAPVGFDERAQGLERLGERAEGSSVAFLGVDRFSAYHLRGTEVRSPGGFVPPGVNARSRKRWRQGLAMDFDTLSPAKLDRFDHVVTTTAAYQSSAPPNFRRIAADGDYALWERTGSTPVNRVLPGEGGDPGAVLDCEGQAPEERFGAGTQAIVIGAPVVGDPDDWHGAEPVPEREAAAGQEGAFRAPTTVSQTLELSGGEWLFSLQYHSQVPLVVEATGARTELPPSLDGMYLDGAGRGAFWPAGRIEVAPADANRPTTVTVRAAEPSALQRALGVERRLWLGRLAATPAAVEPREIPVEAACDRYVDRILPPE